MISSRYSQPWITFESKRKILRKKRAYNKFKRKNWTLNLIQLILVCSGDTEINPCPKTKNQISFCHCNLNGLAAHSFTKVSLLQALSVTHDYDVICLSETFLDSSISNEDQRINIKGYNLLRADHTSNKYLNVL